MHDFHAGAQTLMVRHFSHQDPPEGFNSNSFGGKGPKGAFGSQGGLVDLEEEMVGLFIFIFLLKNIYFMLPESLIWTYVVQLSSALRTIHTAGLACRVIPPRLSSVQSHASRLTVSAYLMC